MTPRTRVFLTVLIVLLGAVLQTLAQAVPIAMQPWQYNLATATIVAVFSAALWVGAQPRHARHARYSPRASTRTAPADSTN